MTKLTETQILDITRPYFKDGARWPSDAIDMARALESAINNIKANEAKIQIVDPDDEPNEIYGWYVAFADGSSRVYPVEQEIQQFVASGAVCLALVSKDSHHWQPIATAPRDQTAILVMCDVWPGTKTGRANDCNGHNTYVVEWWAGEKNHDGELGAWVCYMDQVREPLCPVDPTYWQHLPPPPIKQGI